MEGTFRVNIWKSERAWSLVGGSVGGALAAGVSRGQAVRPEYDQAKGLDFSPEGTGGGGPSSW